MTDYTAQVPTVPTRARIDIYNAPFSTAVVSVDYNVGIVTKSFLPRPGTSHDTTKYTT